MFYFKSVRMKIGFPNNPVKDVLKEIEWIGKNGFDYVDLFIEETEASPEKINTKKVNRILAKYGLGTMGHIAWYLPIGSPDSEIRQSAVEDSANYFRVFRETGTNFATVHANWPESRKASEAIRLQSKSLNEMVKIASEYGVRIMYEPLSTKHDTAENVARILSRVKGLFFNLDIGHANLFGRDPVMFIRRFRKKLVHVHLHDNDGVSDLHLPICCGTVDWTETLHELKKYYDGTITLEVYSHDKSYALLTREILVRIWKSV